MPDERKPRTLPVERKSEAKPLERKPAPKGAAPAWPPIQADDD